MQAGRTMNSWCLHIIIVIKWCDRPSLLCFFPPEFWHHAPLCHSKRMYCLSSDKQKRRDCDGLIAHWPFFYYSFLFIKWWGTANVHRMWSTFNHKTYFTYLFGFYWNERETLYSSITTYVVSGYFAWEDFYLFERI